MEFVFGETMRGGVVTETLKTVGDEHTDFSGSVTTERKYDDRNITDRFEIISKYRSKDGDDRKKYDWYFIKNHSRDTDWYTPRAEDIQGKIDYIAMMSGIDLDTDEGEEGLHGTL